jgi:hypothetical protein
MRFEINNERHHAFLHVGHDWSESFADKLAAMADDAMDRMKEGDL